MSNVTPARNEAASTHTPLVWTWARLCALFCRLWALFDFCSLICLLQRTPGSVGGSPDPAQLVERLQSLKSRLSNMTKTLEQSVAAASPLRGSANEDILYSTPKHVMQLLEGPLGQV